MKLISNGKITGTYDAETKLNHSANGEEFQLILSTFDLIKRASKEQHIHPPCFGSDGSTQLNIDEYLAKEQGSINSFPDCAIINETEIICIEHTKIDASKATGRKGSAYQQSLGTAENLPKIFDNDFPESFNAFLAENKIEFSIPNLCEQLMVALKKKVTKIPKYKEAIAKHIQSGTNQKFIQEDLSKPILAWLFIEDISPTTSFDGLFSNEEILQFLEEHNELSGIIFLHHPHVTTAPQNVSEIALIFNNPSALKELRALSQGL